MIRLKWYFECLRHICGKEIEVKNNKKNYKIKNAKPNFDWYTLIFLFAIFFTVILTRIVTSIWLQTIFWNQRYSIRLKSFLTSIASVSPMVLIYFPRTRLNFKKRLLIYTCFKFNKRTLIKTSYIYAYEYYNLKESSYIHTNNSIKKNLLIYYTPALWSLEKKPRTICLLSVIHVIWSAFRNKDNIKTSSLIVSLKKARYLAICIKT